MNTIQLLLLSNQLAMRNSMAQVYAMAARTSTARHDMIASVIRTFKSGDLDAGNYTVEGMIPGAFVKPIDVTLVDTDLELEQDVLLPYTMTLVDSQDLVMLEMLTQRDQSTVNTYTKVKEFQIGIAGTIRVKLEGMHSIGRQTPTPVRQWLAEFRIAGNVMAQLSGYATSWETKQTTFAVSAGDQVDVYLCNYNYSGTSGVASIKNLQVLGACELLTTEATID